jgi:cytochrome b561
MNVRNTSDRYGLAARLLHWSMALLLLALIALGLYMTALEDNDFKWSLYDLHKSLGVCAWLLLLARMLWRHLSPPPLLPQSMSHRDQMMAHLGHFALYLTMLALPLSGYLDSAFGGYHVSVFGWFDVPLLFDKNQPLFELSVRVHQLAGYLLILFVLAHVGAALHHHFVQRDGILARMTGRG